MTSHDTIFGPYRVGGCIRIIRHKLASSLGNSEQDPAIQN